MPRLYVPASTMPLLGEIRLPRRIGVGERSLEVLFDAREGLWRSFYLDEDAVDDLVDEGVLPDPEEGPLATQLLLVHGDRGLPTESEVAELREVGRVSIEGARFTLADAALASALAADAGFSELLDGVHGPLRERNGVTVMLSGDGRALVWADASELPSLVFVEIY
jgi:hypothetical protein